jgi:serine/threonine protein kinase
MGEVWRAHDQVLNRAVAVKVMVKVVTSDPELLARFHREATIAARLQHPGIAAVYDFGEPEGVPFIAMELLAGPNLAEVRAAHPGGLPSDMAAELVAQAASALAYAHGKGIVHRDIKPANLMRAADGGVKLCDFGLARFMDGAGGFRADGAVPVTRLTHVGTVLGTPAYMAPEQWRGEAADARTDLYALGATLHALLTGAPPFPGPTIDALRHQHLNAPPPRLEALRPGMPAALSDLLQRLLAKDPGSRPASAAEVSDALSALRFRHPPEAQSSSATTVAATDRERAKNKASQAFNAGFWAFGVFAGLPVGINAYDSQNTWHGFHVSLALDLVVGFLGVGGIAGCLLWFVGYYSAKKTRSDIFTFDAEKLSITRWTLRVRGLQVERPLSVSWEALGRVTIEPRGTYSYKLIVWFLPDRQPSPAWVQKHRVRRRRDGSYVIYRTFDIINILRRWRSGSSMGPSQALAPTPAPVEQLRETLAKYAGPLYQDPGHVPDP